MMTTILFIGGTALVAGLCYLALRPLIIARWELWQKDRNQSRARQQYEHRQRVLRAEASLSVLKQLADQEEEARRRTGRKAA